MNGLVIVLSILLAFVIDASWDGVKNNRSESAALVRLHTELIGVDDALADWQSGQRGIGIASRTLLEQFDIPASNRISIDSVSVLLSRIMIPWSLDPPSAILESVESSGLVASLQNERLVFELATWKAGLVDLVADEDLIVLRVEQELRPFMMSRVAWRTVESSQQRISKLSKSQFDYGVDELFQSRDFENHLTWRLRGAESLVQSYQEVREVLSELLKSLSSEL